MYYDLKIRETKTFIMTIIVIVIVVLPIHWMLQAGLSVTTYQSCQRQWAIDQNMIENLDEIYAGFAKNCYT